MAQEYRQHVFKPPEGAADLLLIRHGESQAAVDGVPFPLKDGHGDPALHPNGEDQARALGHGGDLRQCERLVDAVVLEEENSRHGIILPAVIHLDSITGIVEL